MAPSPHPRRPSSAASSSSSTQQQRQSTLVSHPPRTPTGSPRSSRPRSLSTETDQQHGGIASLTPSSTRTRTTSASGSITPKASLHQQRRLSSATTPSKSEYRYSIGPSPVRFPRASSEANNGSNFEPSASTSSRNSLLPPSREASPAPTRSKRNAGVSGGVHVASPSSASARTTSPRPPHSSTALQSAMARDDDDLPRASSSSSTLSPPPPPRRPGASPAQSQTEDRRPSNSSRSLKLTTFPFPHPTTPKGSTLDARYRGEHEGGASGAVARILGGVARSLSGVISMPSAWYGSEPRDQEPATTPGAVRQHDAAQLPPSTSSTAAAQQPLFNDRDRSLRRQTDYGTLTRGGGGGASSRPSSRPVSYHARIISDGDPDPSDPYGYRRLAGPELLPTYHAEHLEPRRKAAARRRRRGFARICGLEGAREDDDEETIRERRRRAVLAASIVGVALALCLVASWWGFFRLGLEEGEEEP